MLDNHPVRANPRNGAVSLMARPPLLKNGGVSEPHDPIFFKNLRHWVLHTRSFIE